ncbi:hypothetical protein KIF59_19725 [Enterobacter cloacae subsp. cloacae]|nr:hypothetical protein [Enterobacter cloacae subsp. cloacae]
MNLFSLSDFEFSPMKDLVDDGPSEPLFTPSVMPEAEPVRQQPAPAPQAYAQPRSLRHPCEPQQPQQPQQPPAAAIPAASGTAAESLIHPADA